MTAHYVPVGWNAAKRRYDALLLSGIASWLLLYFVAAEAMADLKAPHDTLSIAIKALGSAAFTLLTLLLLIGPLARLDARALPLLYNRRHPGVFTCLMAIAHALCVLAWHFTHDDLAFWPWLSTLDITLGQDTGLPFVPLGMASLLIMVLLASTSHDFWLAFLTPPVWKALHMAAYLAWALAVGHFAFGALQTAPDPLLAMALFGACVLVVGLHLAAAGRERAADAALKIEGGWVRAGPHAAIPEGRAIVVRPEGGERVAIFRHQGELSAVAAVCPHQNGPLGEGRIIDGLITCPWHGFQFRPHDGCAPAPYTDRVATYRLNLDGPDVLLHPVPNPPGTPVPPLKVPR